MSQCLGATHDVAADWLRQRQVHDSASYCWVRLLHCDGVTRQRHWQSVSDMSWMLTVFTDTSSSSTNSILSTYSRLHTTNCHFRWDTVHTVALKATHFVIAYTFKTPKSIFVILVNWKSVKLALFLIYLLTDFLVKKSKNQTMSSLL